MNVTLRQLRVFTGVYRTRSITRAPRELGITQSAASLLIQQLESQLGVKLFDRSTRSVNRHWPPMKPSTPPNGC
jgi:DNA-binding transcriptional LysR family regulator